jgi:D-beta-D-heptose 7-phosphate kinase/D-beta-D-heptose 1-phosphate adenosyltransferase
MLLRGVGFVGRCFSPLAFKPELRVVGKYHIEPLCVLEGGCKGEKVKGAIRLAIVGDLILDEYLLGTPERISPEAPVPVTRVESKDYCLGGAANVAANARALGAQVSLFGVVGKDAQGEILLGMLEEMGVFGQGVLVDLHRFTTLKSRVVALPTRQQLIRLDREEVRGLSPEQREELVARVRDLGPFHAILVSDYSKGVVVPGIVEKLKRDLPGVSLLVDPKGQDFSLYKGADLVKPNRKEALALAPSIDGGAGEIFSLVGCDWVLVTLGKEGMVLFSKDGGEQLFPAQAREVYDVTGAGDTVLAALGVFMGEGMAVEEAVGMANVAAGLAVEKVGTAAVTREEVERALVGKGKTFSPKVLKGILDSLKARGKRVVFTNGCFDLLHPGHLDLLRRARREGDVLVVAINSDESVRRLKGPGRPVFSQDERAALLAGLEFVDFVTVFEEDTPYEAISLLRPHVLAKGKDYRLEEVVGRDLVEQVVLVPLKEGYSTTRLMERIRHVGSHK